MSQGQGLTFEEIRNEAVQMFRDMPDNLRETLYNQLVEDPQLPSSLRDPYVDPSARALFYMTRHRTEDNWAELNSVLATMVLDDLADELSDASLMTVYRLIHTKLRGLGQSPAPGARHTPPPVVAWLANRIGHQRYSLMARAAGLTTPGSLSVPGAGTGGKRSSFSKRGKRKSQKHRKTLKRKSRKHKAKKY